MGLMHVGDEKKIAQCTMGRKRALFIIIFGNPSFRIRVPLTS